MGEWESAEGVDVIPPAACDFGGSGGAYFVAMEDQDRIVTFPARDFIGLSKQVLVPGEIATSIGLFASDGDSIHVSTFSDPMGTPDLEGSDFFPCPP